MDSFIDKPGINKSGLIFLPRKKRRRTIGTNCVEQKKREKNLYQQEDDCIEENIIK